MLGCSNQANPFAFPVPGPDGATQTADVSERVKAVLEEREIDILVLVGGDGTLDIGMRFEKMGVPVVGVPKAIDNDRPAVIDVTVERGGEASPWKYLVG